MLQRAGPGCDANSQQQLLHRTALTSRREWPAPRDADVPAVVPKRSDCWHQRPVERRCVANNRRCRYLLPVPPHGQRGRSTNQSSGMLQTVQCLLQQLVDPPEGACWKRSRIFPHQMATGPSRGVFCAAVISAMRWAIGGTGASASSTAPITTKIMVPPFG